MFDPTEPLKTILNNYMCKKNYLKKQGYTSVMEKDSDIGTEYISNKSLKPCVTIKSTTLKDSFCIQRGIKGFDVSLVHYNIRQ